MSTRPVAPRLEKHSRIEVYEQGCFKSRPQRWDVNPGSTFSKSPLPN